MPDDPRIYMQIANALREQILDGEYKPGQRFPTVEAIAQEAGHSRGTCGHALRVLRDEGLLSRYPGHGYYVADPASQPAGRHQEVAP